MWSASICTRSLASTTGRLEARSSSAGRMLSCVGSRCWTMTKAAPVSDLSNGSNASRAEMPPADAPIPTTGTLLGRASGSAGCFCLGILLMRLCAVLLQRSGYHFATRPAMTNEGLHDLGVLVVVEG